MYQHVTDKTAICNGFQARMANFDIFQGLTSNLPNPMLSLALQEPYRAVKPNRGNQKHGFILPLLNIQ